MSVWGEKKKKLLLVLIFDESFILRWKFFDFFFLSRPTLLTSIISRSRWRWRLELSIKLAHPFESSMSCLGNTRLRLTCVRDPPRRRIRRARIPWLRNEICHEYCISRCAVKKRIYLPETLIKDDGDAPGNIRCWQVEEQEM